MFNQHYEITSHEQIERRWKEDMDAVQQQWLDGQLTQGEYYDTIKGINNWTQQMHVILNQRER